MKYIYYYIWLALAILHPILSKVFIPMNILIRKVGNKSEADYRTWKKNYSKANLDFPGGINDWFAFAFLLVLILAPIIVLLISFDMETGLFNSKFRLYSLFIGVALFCYYWIYFKNIDWLKERINKVSKKYYIK